ncbi:MAG: membrane protein insertion efficiency factor YidD [Dehalococcoidales bacterium]|nr:membrane protein insertion efficiency factor YidD [Dehalococcoidales bacterium]
MKEFALELISLYQLTLSRVMPPSCRFTPTCSQYAYEAVDKYGFFKGVRMGIKRIAHCHPFNPGGHDPVS